MTNTTPARTLLTSLESGGHMAKDARDAVNGENVCQSATFIRDVRASDPDCDKLAAVLVDKAKSIGGELALETPDYADNGGCFGVWLDGDTLLARDPDLFMALDAAHAELIALAANAPDLVHG